MKVAFYVFVGISLWFLILAAFIIAAPDLTVIATCLIVFSDTLVSGALARYFYPIEVAA
jgi:hypothetical protein